MTDELKLPNSSNYGFVSKLSVFVFFCCATFLAGCSADDGDEISDADFRSAFNELEKLGARITEENEPLIDSSVNMVELFPEHFDDDGQILREVLKPLRNVRSCLLILYNSRITDEGMQALSGYRNLLGINLHYTSISDEGLLHIRNLKQLLLLKLSHTRITHVGLTHLADFDNLGLLYVAGLEITDATLAQLARMPSLRAVNLAETIVQDDGVKKLLPLEKLKYLGLDSTSITDACFEDLKQFPDLQHLEVTKTDLSDEAIEKLAEFYPDGTVIHDR